MQRFLKPYFWFLVVANVLAYVANALYYRTETHVLLLISADIILSGFVLYTFYCIAYDKVLRYRSFLKLFLPVFLIWEIVIFYVFQVHIQGAMSSLPVMVLAWLIYLPEYITVAMRTYRSKEAPVLMVIPESDSPIQV